MPAISNPFPLFTDADGAPLDDAYIYVGAANQNPVSSPITVYWDESLTIAAAQPIRTSNGYPMRNGTPSRFYAGANYSILVRDKNGSFVFQSGAGLDQFSNYGSAILSISNLRLLPIPLENTVVRVIGRQGGFFRYASGNVSAQVTLDTYGGIWIAPNSAPSGISGAWERIVENDIYDSEWWLPDVMPTNAQVRINASFDIIPAATARKLLLPRRVVTVTGTVILKHGIEYEGAGQNGRFDGQGGSGFFPITIAASNSKLWNISSGNVTGTAVQGEPGGFHITDGLPIFGSDGIPIENVSAIDCHAYNARTGFRVGYKSTGTAGATNIFGSRDTYIENFTCDGIGRIGIETMRSHGVEIIGGVVRMTQDTFDPSGLKRGVRVVGAHQVNIKALRIIGASDAGNTGVSVEPAANFSSSSVSTNVTVEGCVFENCREECVRIGAGSSGVQILGNRGTGWDDTNAGRFLRVVAEMGSGGEAKSILVANNQSENINIFSRLEGRVIGLDVLSNFSISNNSTTTRFFETSGNAANDEIIWAKIIGNTGIGNGLGTGGFFRYAGMTASSEITIDDNHFTADSAGAVFVFSGDGVVRTKSQQSNKVLPATLWSQVRPPLGQGTY